VVCRVQGEGCRVSGVECRVQGEGTSSIGFMSTSWKSDPTRDSNLWYTCSQSVGVGVHDTPAS